MSDYGAEGKQRLCGVIKMSGHPFVKTPFGFIMVAGADDVFVDKSACLFNTNAFNVGTAVSFDRTPNHRERRYEAQNVRLLHEEQDVALLGQCMASSWVPIRIAASCGHLNQMEKGSALRELSQIQGTIQKHPQQYLPLLSEKFFKQVEMVWLRNLLDDKRHVGFCVEILNSTEIGIDVRQSIIEELVQAIGRTEMVYEKECWGGASRSGNDQYGVHWLSWEFIEVFAGGLC
jgi:cold shock CspA family protein